jgi:hypothetical protein
MSSQTIARGEAACRHPENEALIWKFNSGNPAYLCPRCRTIVGYSVHGRSDMTLAELRSKKQALA